MAGAKRLIALSFGVALLAVAGVAFAASLDLRSQITGEARGNAQKQATLLARTSFGQTLEDESDAGRRRIELDHAATGAKASLGLLQATVYDGQGRIIYDLDRSLIGRTPAMTPRLRQALAGRANSSIVTGGDPATEPTAERRIETLVPIDKNGQLIGIVHLDLPYGPVQADITSRTRRMNVIVGLAGLILYLVALPGLVRLARTLDREVDPRRRRVVKEIRSALGAGGEISLEYQPIVDLATGEVQAAEALVRWDHPTRGRIPPDHFLPFLEDSPVFWEFTLHVLELAIAQAARWHAAGRHIAVAANVSVGDVLDERLPRKLDELCAKYGVPSRLVELEVTEQAVMDRVDDAVDVLAALRRQGVGIIAIDDFGTGYSSLARVRDLPIQALKIDRSFIAEMEAREDPALVRSIIAMAHNLGLHVIAEGIETEATWARLRALGCDAAQGYLISRPRPRGTFDEWLEMHRPDELAALGQARVPERRVGTGRRTEDLFAAGFDGLPDAVAVFDDNGRYVYANAATGALYGRDAQDLIGRSFAAVTRAENRARAEEIWRTVRRDGCARLRVAVTGADGRVTEVESRIQADVMPGRHIAIMREYSDGEPR